MSKNNMQIVDTRISREFQCTGTSLPNVYFGLARTSSGRPTLAALDGGPTYLPVKVK